MHSWQGWGLKIHHTSSDYAYTIPCPWQLGWWCCMRCLSMAAFTAFNIYWFVDINKFIEPMTSCHHQSLSYLLLQSFNLTNLYIKLWKCLQSYQLDNVKLPSAAEIPSILLHSIVLEITYGNWAAIWWPLVQTPSWLQSIKKRFLLHLRLKMEDLFFLFTLF